MTITRRVHRELCNGLVLTRIQVRMLDQPIESTKSKSTLYGWVNVELNGAIWINNFRIVKAQKGSFLAPPSEKGEKRYFAIASFPKSISDLILEEVRRLVREARRTAS